MALKNLFHSTAIAGGIVLSGCANDVESERQTIAISTAPLVNPFTTALGYEVHLRQIHFLVESQHFTREGEAHLARWWVPSIASAFAHPGHNQGGEIVGETHGVHLITFNFEQNFVADATVLRGAIEAGDLTLRNRLEEDPFDVLPVGTSTRVSGQALLDGEAWEFVVSFGQSEKTSIVGIPVETLQEGGRAIELHFDAMIFGENAEATIFDTIDFAVDTEAIGNDEVTFTASAINRLRRVLNRHDWYRFTLQ